MLGGFLLVAAGLAALAMLAFMRRDLALAHRSRRRAAMAVGSGTRLRITEYGWTDGVPFFITQRVLADPDAFLQFYANRIRPADWY